MAAADEQPGELLFFPGVIAEEVLQRREHAADETREGIKLVMGDLDALAEIHRGLAHGNWPNARAYVCTEMETRLAVLRELLGAS